MRSWPLPKKSSGVLRDHIIGHLIGELPLAMLTLSVSSGYLAT